MRTLKNGFNLSVSEKDTHRGRERAGQTGAGMRGKAKGERIEETEREVKEEQRKSSEKK